MIDGREIQDPQCERGRVAVDGERANGEHPAWCSPAHCFVTDEEVRVHQQVPTRWEAQCVVPLRFETYLIDPGDDDDTYLELRMRDLKLRDQFHAFLTLDTARRLRDQLTEHLDAASTATDPTEADSCPSVKLVAGADLDAGVAR